MAQPAMHAIWQQNPERKIFVTGKPWLRDLIPFLQIGEAEYSDNCAVAASEAFIFRNSLSSAWQVFRQRIPQRHGFAHDGRSLLLRPAYQPNVDMRHQHHRLYFLDLVRQAGIQVEADKEVSLHAGDDELAAGRALMQAHGIQAERCICVAPGAQFGGAKRYPDQAYRQILQTLSKEGWQPIILGTAAEHAIGDQCLVDCNVPSWNACGATSLRQALQLVSSCCLLLCNDSGLMHVAAGLGQPVVAMFGATDPQRTAPSGPDTHLLYQPAPCSPCLQRECHTPGHPCMRNISVDTILDHCHSALQKKPPE